VIVSALIDPLISLFFSASSLDTALQVTVPTLGGGEATFSFGAIIGATLLFVLAVEAVGIALVAWLANLRFATSAAAFLSGPAFAFSGITFPVAAMPLAAQTWSALIPLTHYLRVMVDQAVRGAPLAVSSLPLAALAAFVLLLPVASLGRLRRVATDERFWGRL